MLGWELGLPRVWVWVPVLELQQREWAQLQRVWVLLQQVLVLRHWALVLQPWVLVLPQLESALAHLPELEPVLVSVKEREWELFVQERERERVLRVWALGSEQAPQPVRLQPVQEQAMEPFEERQELEIPVLVS